MKTLIYKGGLKAGTVTKLGDFDGKEIMLTVGENLEVNNEVAEQIHVRYPGVFQESVEAPAAFRPTPPRKPESE